MTLLTGAINNPAAAGQSGRLLLTLLRQASLLSTGGCGGPAVILPGTPVIFPVYAGAIGGNVWKPNTAYAIGDLLVPTLTGTGAPGGAPQGIVYRVYVAGVTDSTEPIWPTNGVPFNSGTVGFVEVSRTQVYGLDCLSPAGLYYQAQFRDAQNNLLFQENWNCITGTSVDVGGCVPITVQPTATIVQGPVGPTGPQGNQGAAGTPGAPGTPGSAGGNGWVNTVTDASVPSGNAAGSGASANAALTSAMSNYPGQTLMVPSGAFHHITADLTITTAMVIGGSGGFYIDSGKTLRLNGELSAPITSRIFFGPGAVKINGNQEVWIGWFGGKGDGRQAYSCSISAGSNILTCTSGQAFSATDIGKLVIPWNYGDYSYSPDFTVASITGFTSTTTVRLNVLSGRTITNLMVVQYGTDNLDAFNAAVAAKPCGTLKIPPSLAENVAYGGGPTVTSGITYPSLGGDYLFRDHIELGWPLTSACNGFTVAGAGYTSGYGSSPTLRFPMQSGGGIWVRSELYGVHLKDLVLIGSAPWHQSFLASYTIPGNTNVYDARNYYYNGVTLQGGGQPFLENVQVYAFAGNGVAVDGGCNLVPPNAANTAGCQPDFWRIDQFKSWWNRGCGLLVHGGDSNGGMLNGYDIQFNSLCGVQESSNLSTNVYAGGGMHGNSNNNGLAGGTTQALTSCSVTSNVMTCTASSNLANNIPQLAMWVTASGQADASFNGTCRISALIGTTQFQCPFTHADGSTTGGTVRTASATETMTARDTLLQAVGATPYKAGSWRGAAGQPTVLVSPYLEANQPCPQGLNGALQIGGTLPTDVCLVNGKVNIQWPFIAAGAGGMILHTASGAGVTLRSMFDGSTVYLNLRPGIANSEGGTIEGVASIRWWDRAANDKWSWAASIGAQIGLLDHINGGYRFVATAGGDVKVQSKGSTTKLNWDSGSGVDFGDGAGNKIGGVDTAGLSTFNGGMKPSSASDATTFFKKTTHASLDLSLVASGACTSEVTETVTGAALGDACAVAAGTALEAGGFFRCAVTNTNEVKWQFCNLSGSTIDRGSDTYTIRVWR